MMAAKMVTSIIGLLMAFYVCQFSAVPIDDEEAAIIAELEKAPLEDTDINDLFEDESDLFTRSGFVDKIEEKCKCYSRKCTCCGTPTIAGFSFNACVNMTMYPGQKVFEMSAGFGDNTLARNISVAKIEKMCGRLPGFLKTIQLCMYNTWNDDLDESMSTCSSIDVMFGGTIVASIQFHCLDYNNGRVTFSIPPDTGRSAVMSFKMKNPVKSLISYIKRKFNNE